MGDVNRKLLDAQGQREDGGLRWGAHYIHPLAELLRKAHGERVKNLGPTVHFRAIIEFSNYCRQDCLFCGLRRSNGKLRRYRMSSQEIIKTVRQVNEIHRFGTIVLQSGEDPGYPQKDICEVVEAIKHMGAAVTLSLGQRTKEEYRAWKEAGADRYLIKFETSDERLFRKMKPTTTLAERLKCLNDLQDLGYQVGSGIILGLPFQTWQSVFEDLRLMRELDLEMVSVGPFIPHPDTPLGGFAPRPPVPESQELGVLEACEARRQISPLKGISSAQLLIHATLKVIALSRLSMPMAHIPGTTALGVLSQKIGKRFDARALALLAGANVIMPDLTPKEFRDAYEIYPGKSSPHWEMATAVQEAKSLLFSAGMEIDQGKGDSPKTKFKGDGNGARGTGSGRSFEGTTQWEGR